MPDADAQSLVADMQAVGLVDRGGPLGALQTRRLASSRATTSLPGVPDEVRLAALIAKLGVPE